MESDTDLVRRALFESGMTIRTFAWWYAGRDPRTVRRWLEGSPVPALVAANLREWFSAH